MELFAQLHGAGNTVILVTHATAIAAHAHREVKLRDGRVLTDVGQPRP
jgi:putative ABC transport system ATP-binding protein